MPRLQILHYPHPLLERAAAPVTVFDDDLRDLAQSLLQTMYDAPGIGITACHVGILKRIVVIDLERGQPQFFINPRITWISENISEATEGSVSMPGILDTLSRPSSIQFEYQDMNGMAHASEATGLLGTCLQHEIDQLDGVFWIKRLSRLKRDRLLKRYRKIHDCSACCGNASHSHDA